MMHTPRTTLMLPRRRAPVPRCLDWVRVLLHAGILASRKSRDGHWRRYCWRGQESATIDALRDALADSDSSVRAAAVHSISLRNDPALKKNWYRY